MSNNCQVQSKVMSGIFKSNIHIPNVHSKTDRFIIRAKSHKKLCLGCTLICCMLTVNFIQCISIFLPLLNVMHLTQARRRSKTYLQGSSTFIGNANPVCAGLSVQSEASQHTWKLPTLRQGFLNDSVSHTAAPPHLLFLFSSPKAPLVQW